jgi:DNA excision repair protein ERCC-3
LLQQILAASDFDAEEEKLPGEGRTGGNAYGRKNASLASISGADDSVYREFKKPSGGPTHPLFKKLRNK